HTAMSLELDIEPVSPLGGGGSSSARKNSLPPTNSQTSDPALQRVPGKRNKMVAPGTKDASRFRSDKPEELRRFLSRMEDIWQEAGVTNDKQKKLPVGKYAD